MGRKGGRCDSCHPDMGNSTLDDRARELESHLAPKLKCYVKVGWMKESDGSVIFMVYADSRADIDWTAFPSEWYGSDVLPHLVLPPGVKPPEPLPEMPWM